MEIVGEQSRQSLPVPLMRKEGLYVLFFYYPARAIPRQSSKIFTPHYLLSLRADGTFDELRAVTSKDFSQLHRADEIVGTHGLPEGLTLELYYQNLAQLYEVYDVLMPQFGAGRSAIGPEIMSAAKEFRDFFGLISETPLKPYYDFLGTGFFEWIAQASERRSRHQNLGRGHLPASSFIADDLASTTGPVVLGPRNIEDDVAIAEEQNNIVGEIVEQQDKGRFEISFCHLAAVYFLRKDSPKSSDWLALLKKSLSEERPVNFHHVVGWQQITYVELAQRQRSRSFGDQVQEMSAFRMRTGPVDRRPSRK
ncbi:MAG: hypothetical protein JXO72_01175 [Vicinamibacteria bacterium]|nr:hypothetical protein [Vicinamibacteria bacterium]